MTGHRLAHGGLIDRSREIGFRFDEMRLAGHPGDTLASALLANGVHLVGRSFKYHRPRGILTAGSAEPNALVELRTGGRREPNTRATEIELFDGLVAASQNRWPNLRHDLLQVNDLFSRFLAAGFYYKTFMWPPQAWLTYEKFIRRAAGLGSAADEPDPDRYERQNIHCDVLVIGAGPAGLAAAEAAGRAHQRAILLDEGDRPGGSLLGERLDLDGAPALDWVEDMVATLAERPETRVLTRTTAFGIYDGNLVGALERVSDHLATPTPFVPRQRYWRIRAGRVVCATGALERPLVFGDNDRPGVMLASAVRTYVNRYGVALGRRAVVFATNDDGYRTALDLHAAGIAVAAVVDARGEDGEWRARTRAAGIEVLSAHVVIRARGGRRVQAVEVAAMASGGPVRRIACDLLAMSGGHDPALHLLSHAGAVAEYDPEIAALRPGEGARGDIRAVGGANGTFDLAAAICEAGGEAPALEAPVVGRPLALWRVPGAKGKAFVDPQNDVTADDIELAHREGYISVEHLKRYTTLGMGTDQGKLGNVNGLALMAEARGAEIGQVGSTTYRPPYVPVSIGALVGRDVGQHEAPVRRSAMHDWHQANGAVFVEAGAWLRPQYYLDPGQKDTRAAMDRAITREVVETRNGVGLVDVSTLGKIDIQGPDSAEFLNRLYTNGWKGLEVGRARYGLMLREDGLVWDDGTTSRLDDDHYLMTTTTTNAGAVMSHLEYYLQLVWPEFDVKAVSVTEQWAAMALAGPKARDVLAAVVPELDVSNEAFPFMGVRFAEVAGVPARIFRISFSGELSYEINVGADWGERVWRAIHGAGAAHGLRPYGTEAMAIMRIEKGHVAGGELNGQTTAEDLGLGRMMSRRKDYIGLAMVDREGIADVMRPRFVGIVPVDGVTRIRAGAHLVEDPDRPPPIPRLGHVSSSAYLSPTLGHPIALGFCKGGEKRIGDEVWALSPVHDQRVKVRLADPVFYDADGGRQRG